MRKLALAFVVVLLVAAVLKRLVAQEPAPAAAVKAADLASVKLEGEPVKAVARGVKRCPRRC